MFIDFHTRIFPPYIRDHRERYCARDPWSNERYSNPQASMASAEVLIAEMDASGVDISVAFSFGWTDIGLIEEMNSYVIDSMHRYLFFFQAEDGIRDSSVTGVQTCALPI